MGLDTSLREALLGAGMNGKDYRNLGSDSVNGAEEFGEFFRGIHIRRAMQGEHGKALPVSSLLEGQILADEGIFGDGQKMAKRIDHDVANEINGLAGAAFFEEMLDGVFFRDEKIVGQGIGENAVDFFGHGSVETAESGFDVSDRDAKFYGGERNSDGGIDVADDENEIWLVFEQDRLDALEHFGSLRGVGAGADFEIDVRRGNTHLTEEDVRESFIVVLAGVDEDGVDFGMALHLADQRSDLGEIGASANDIDDFQLTAHGMVGSVRERQYSI